MLTPAVYLVEADFWAGPGHTAPPPPPVLAVLGQLRELFGDDAALDAAGTDAALRVALVAVEHLSDAVPHARLTIPGSDATGHLLLGYNLLAAHLAQSLARLADLVLDGTGPDLSSLTGRQRGELWLHVSLAGRRMEEAAANVKRAHQAIRLTCVPPADDQHR